MVAFALLGTAGTILFALELSAFVARADWANLWLALLGGALKAVTVFAQEWFSALAAAKVKTQLRTKLFEKLFAANQSWHDQQYSAELTQLLTGGLDSLDAYFSKFLPQVVYTSLAMPIFVITVFNQDALSALIIMVTMPLIPLFMVFIGWATERVQKRQLARMTELSKFFGEIIRGLLTLRIFNRAEAQIASLTDLSVRHRKQTMKVLSVSFLSGFALELIASLSVALIAVSIGLRLINGQMDYRVGLFVLLLAPDAYLPLRMIGANFHASTEGVTAIGRTFELLDQPVAPLKSRSIEPVAAGLTVLVGESGAGKSTALEALVGERTAWVTQVPVIFPGTVTQNVAGFDAANKVLLAEAMAIAGVDDVAPGQGLSEVNQALSGGQAARVALARGVYRLLTDRADTLLLDEPLAAQDSARANSIVANLCKLTKRGFTVVAVSHQDALIKVADKVVEF